VQGEESPRTIAAFELQHFAGGGCAHFKTDYVACPSCGRTLFNLQTTTARIKAATVHLKGVKIAIMGCIVNGPGEMADADFGYVGGAPGKVNLYVGKQAVKLISGSRSSRSTKGFDSRARQVGGTGRARPPRWKLSPRKVGGQRARR